MYFANFALNCTYRLLLFLAYIPVCNLYQICIFSSNNQTEDNYIYIYIASNDDELIRTYNLYMYLKIVLNVNIRLRVNIMIII